jgi:hypothetical protein
MRQHVERDRWIFEQLWSSWSMAPLPPGVAPPGNLSELIHILPGLPPAVANVVAAEVLRLMVATGYFSDLDEPLQRIRTRIAAGLDYRHQVKGWRQSVARHKTNAEACFERQLDRLTGPRVRL